MIKNYKIFLENKKTKFPNLRKVQYDDFLIYIGKDAKSNDYLTFNIADDNDIWMHAKGVIGSHVVIKVKDKIPTNSIIKYAGELAKKNSKSKNESNVDIVYCKRKFVKKEIGMNDGQVKVDYINSQTINI